MRLHKKLASRARKPYQLVLLIRELMTTGMVALVDGQTPRALEERLLAFISPNHRPVSQDAA